MGMHHTLVMEGHTQIPVPEYVARPEKMMGPIPAVKSVLLRNYRNFSGRASRSELWWFYLMNMIAQSVIMVLLWEYFWLILGTDAANEFFGDIFRSGVESDTIVINVLMGFGLILLIAPLAVLLPSLAVSVRRLHDTGRSGWWMLLGLIPLVNCCGGIVLLLFFVMDGNSHVNAYGDVPTNVVE